MIVKKIDKITTTDGYMVPIFRDWDHDTNMGHTPKMVYATSVKPHVSKDIIFHEKRTSYLTCIQGCVLLECMIDDNIQSRVLDSADVDGKIELVILQPAVPIKLTSMSDDVSILINCPSPAWHPDDTDTHKFKTWKEFEKWKNV